ncbi:uncharacterized protein LOC144168313 [Haemaphysalis longicornis]
MLKFRVYLKLSLFGKRPTPLARLYYQYSRFMNDPLASEFRCLDALESWFRPYLFDYLRRSHVHVYRDIPTNLSLHNATVFLGKAPKTRMKRKRGAKQTRMKIR